METFVKIKRQVHQEPDYDEILKNPSSSYMEKVTCFGAAIGATVATYEVKDIYLLGKFSGKKTTHEYNSYRELKDLYLSDMSTLDLEVEELDVNLNYCTIDTISSVHLNDNQYINLLFANEPRVGKIVGYHFLRYDLKYGWTETWPNRKLLIGDEVQFPHEWSWKLIGVYRVTR